MKGSLFNFDAIAAGYDAWYKKPVGSAYDFMEKEIMELLLPPAHHGATLLEVGSGTGHWSAWFHEKGYGVTGLDISADMIGVAEKRNIPGARFIHGDILDTRINGTFDIVAAVTSLEFTADPVLALERMRLYVRPGGSILIGVLNTCSWMGMIRRLKGEKDAIFHNARFFTMKEAKCLLGAYGDPVIKGGAFLLPYEFLLWSAPFLELAGKYLCPGLGNFIAGKVTI